MGTISRQTTWSTGDTLTASDLNGEFDNILSTANGSLNADNLGVTAGQAAASKAVVLDSNKDFADTSSSNQIRNLTISGSLKIGTTFLPDASGGADLGSTALEWGDVYIADDKKIYLGSDQDISLQYDETTNNALEIAAAVEGAALGIVLKSDQGDDAGDEWKLNIADGGTLTLGNDIASAGTYVTHLTLTPNSTVSSSTLALAGGLTVAGTASITGVATVGGITIGSAVINEAELETIDGITAGTVAASKAVVVDSNKDIGSFRNVTLTGELDAATLDISGNADIDGTTNLDAVDIDGAVQVDATITVGADDQGYDIIFYGDTASANLTWDTSADDLILNGGAGLIVPDGQLTLGSTALAATAAELNVLDGVTAGTVAASKGVVVDANKDIGSFRNVTLTGELDAATLDISGNADIDGTTNLDAVDIDGAVQIDATVTVGVDDTGYDVKFFGATSGSSMLWDESADDLILTNAGLAVGSDATGDLYYRNSSGYLARLGVGSDGQVLTSTGTLPNWEAAAGGGHTIQEEGSSLTQRTNLNFVGAGVTATDDSGNNATKVTVTPTGASLPVTRSDGSTSDPIALTSAALGESLVSDTSPQLGGNLDVNGQSIVSDGSNENIPITPHGTGSVVVSKIDVAAGEIDGTAIGANSASTGAFTTLAASGTTTLSGDQVITDGNGLISGHTARVQVGWATGENQILGTADADANLSITRYSNDNGPPNLFFGKSRGSLGANTIVADGDPLGRITFCGSDGVDMRSAAAWIEAECDGEFEADNVSGRIIFATTPDSSGVQDPVERMRIDSSGNVGVGSNDPDSSAPTGSSSPRILKVAGGTGIDKALQIQGYSDIHGLDLWTDVSTGDVYIDQRGDHDNYDMHFRTKTTGTPINAMTINGSGDVGIGTTSPSYPLHTLTSTSITTAGFVNSHSSAPFGIYISYSGAAPDSGTSNAFIHCRDTGDHRLIVWSDGDVANHDGTYGTLSDIKLKQDIADMRSYLDDFKSLQYRKYRHKSDVATNTDAPYRIGLVAQEVEPVFPSLVVDSTDQEQQDIAVLDEDGNATYEQTEKLDADGNAELDADGNAVMIDRVDDDGNKIAITETKMVDLGTTTKWVKSSIIEGPIMASVVQELQTRLEAAEAKISALEAA